MTRENLADASDTLESAADATGNGDAAERLDYGMVSVNEYPVTFPQTPFGGVKESGTGREQGEEGLEEYMQTKSVWIDLSEEVSDPFKLG